MKRRADSAATIRTQAGACRRLPQGPQAREAVLGRPQPVPQDSQLGAVLDCVDMGFDHRAQRPHPRQERADDGYIDMGLASPSAKRFCTVGRMRGFGHGMIIATKSYISI
ncbi:MAG: hypothetical protein Q8S29_15860, partial [Phreatobacter sp.]|nr:hypothetical protein [Phreatobacter sp.]